MKKILKTLIYLLVFLVIYFAQIYIFENLKIANIKPNIYIIAIIIISIYTKPNKAFVIGVIAGILIDILSAKAIGITAISMGLLAYMVANVEKMFSIESKLSLIIFIFLGTITYEIINYIIHIILLDVGLEIKEIAISISIETMYNVLLTIIFYPICKKILKIGTQEVQEAGVGRYLKKMG